LLGEVDKSGKDAGKSACFPAPWYSFLFPMSDFNLKLAVAISIMIKKVTTTTLLGDRGSLLMISFQVQKKYY
jgi:hypothetical protein